MKLTPTEQYLAGYHDAKAGVISRAFQHLVVTGDAGANFESTYHVLLAALPFVSGAAPAVLDLACGDGHLLALLAAAWPRSTLTGIDLSDGELRAARARLGKGVTLHRCKAQQLPLADASVDAVVSHLALMLMNDIDTVRSEVRRVCKTGATFVGLVGTGPAASPAFDAFNALYAKATRRPELGELRFGDRRFRSIEGIHEWLAPAFEGARIDALRISRDYTPTELWSWHADMYDADLLTPAALTDLRYDYLRAIEPLCDTSGRVHVDDRILCFAARAV